MAVTGCEKWYIACLIGGNHFVWKGIPRNEEDITALINAEKAFWEENVQGGIMPDVDGSKSCSQALAERFPGGVTDSITLPKEADELLAEIDELNEAADRIKDQIESKKNSVKLMLGDHEIAYAGERKVTWKTQAGRVTVDSKKLKAEMPEVYEKYSKQGNPIRVFKI